MQHDGRGNAQIIATRDIIEMQSYAHVPALPAGLQGGNLSDYDLVIIGSGPGGYVAGIRAGQLGLRAAVVEKDELGGLCLNWGCIPSKALIRNAEVLNLVRDASRMGISYDNLSFDFGAAVDRSRRVVKRLTMGVASLLKKNNVDVIRGEGALRDRSTVTIDGEPISTDNVIIATGARFREIPVLPVDGTVVMTSREALASREVPGTVVIVGGGATGVEFAYVYRAYGARVVLVEMLPRLAPAEDEEISRELERAFRRQGIEARTGCTVQSVAVEGRQGRSHDWHRWGIRDDRMRPGAGGGWINGQHRGPGPGRSRGQDRTGFRPGR